MKKYYFDTLLLFLKHQSTQNYHAIEMILSIVEDEECDFLDKQAAVLFLLHSEGLYDININDGQFAPSYPVNFDATIYNKQIQQINPEKAPQLSEDNGLHNGDHHRWVWID